MSTCDVLLATFNSEKWLKPMLSSLAAQTHKDFKLIIADDGSSDKTLQILEEFSSGIDRPIEIYENVPPTGSAQGNFNGLMARSTADYVLFADHDDIWAPNKIAVSLNRLRALEEAYSKTTPALVFSDAFVIDANGRQIAPSFWRFKRIRPELAKSLPHSLVCSGVLGCASAINRASLVLTSPVPASMPGHDWWAGLVANIFGTVEPISQKLLQYRVHGSNVSRPRGASVQTLVATGDKRAVVQHGLERRFAQAEALLTTFGSRIPAPKRAVLEGFVEMRSLPPLERRIRAATRRYLYPDIARNLAYFALM